MNKIFFLLAILGLLIEAPAIAQSDAEAADLFKLKCGICHTIGSGRLVGPDLANVHERRSEEWLLKFIHSSQTMIKSGDPDAMALFEEFNQVIMPDPMITDTEIKSILGYIAANSDGGVGTAEPVSVIEDATPEDLENGKNLFEGRVRFANGGPSCISCHNSQSNIFLAENSFSGKDVGASFDNLGEAGVKAILQNPPFPVMAQAFEGHDLTEGEIHDLLVFLKNVKQPSNLMASGYILFGILGAMGLLVLYGGLWYSRKSKSVNYDIYKRQIKSFN